METIRIFGVEHLTDTLNRLEQVEAVKNAMQQAVLMVHGQAKELCPVDNGNLRLSLHPKVIVEGNDVIGKVYTNVNYAPYVEFGTGAIGNGTYPKKDINLTYTDKTWTYTPDGGETFYKTRGHVAQPFMYPAIKTNKPRIKRMFQDALRNDIRR